MAALTALVVFTAYLSSVRGFKLISNSTLPQNITLACSAALTKDVNCPRVVAALQPGSYYPQKTLESACTTACSGSLAAYRAGVASACGSESWAGYYDEQIPVLMISDLLQYHFNLSCLTDSGRFCNVVAGQAAAAQEAGNSTVSACDLCLIKNLQYQAASPYYDGPFLEPIYESKTSSCKVTGYPLTTTDLDFFTPTSTVASTPTPCAGSTYKIQPGNDCKSISKSQRIGTAWLLTDNGLTAWCENFPTNGTLCLQNPCNTYTLQQNDTCASVAKAHNISTTQLISWNPIINAGCNNLDKSVGYEVCVGQPGKAYATPSASFPAPTYVTTPAPVPTNPAEGTNPRCGRYYNVVLGEYCNLIVIKFGISLEDFIFLNPAINSNCTNLFADESYCVQPVGDINTYSGRPGYVEPTTSVAPIIYTNLPDATYTPTPKPTAVPLANGTRTDCYYYINGDDFQDDYGDSTSARISNCDNIAATFLVTFEELVYWNPSLESYSLANCTFETGVRYCASWSAPSTSPGDDETPLVLPVRDGVTANCTEFYPVINGMTCQYVLDNNDLTIAQFFSYNPAVNSDCSGLWLNYQYCVRAPGYVNETPETTTGDGTLTSMPTTTIGTPTGTTSVPVSTTPSAPTQTGQPTNCIRWHVAVDGDSCYSIINQYFLTESDFYKWNPAVSSDCTSGLWGGYAYCVGTSDAMPTRPTTTPPPSTTTLPAVPTPTNPNSIVSNCNKYSQAVDGDYCYLFAEKNNISTTDLYAWNAVLGSDGSGCATSFWAGYHYCVGVSK
ncbi:hypothetical protein BDN72DRAFT_889204 [Pluteus cervinus]|uniref:Uncharacterized protein n=1 Tax=Pluteus cervinus TaxID=181527 RepID=A0ACD3AJK9_9AGAR|nr:hypothetical protein BDN72DRAFT_889204 [Pluteus cervinus]